ncbi:MAG: hypothetical protein FJX75_28125 [Armatimonadetes bacterium]|nr:hypothetical protein [Armatimonadota bacterium]
MEFRGKLKRKQRRATRERVIEALGNMLPEPPTMYMVQVEGIAYPLKQAFGETFGVGRHDVGTRDARRIMERLGFEVTREPAASRRRAEAEDASAPEKGAGRLRRGEYDPVSWQEINIPTMILRWSCGVRWVDIAGIGESSEEVRVPPNEPGVYCVFRKGDIPALYIGQTTNLRRRIVDALVRGTAMHTAGTLIRENEDLSRLVISWGLTDRPAAVEEELIRRHMEEWRKLPQYASGG